MTDERGGPLLEEGTRVTKSTLCSGLRLNLGCGTRTPDQWMNVDYALGARLGKIAPLRPLLRSVGIFHIEWSASIFIHDLRRPLPWPDGSVAAIYSSHTLEHLTKEAGQRLVISKRTPKDRATATSFQPDKRSLEQGMENTSQSTWHPSLSQTCPLGRQNTRWPRPR